MSLEDLVDNLRTDKNTRHSYLPLYESLLNKKKDSATNILELGIQCGGSIKLWHDYFSNATIYAVDIMLPDTVWDELKNKDRIALYAGYDGYRDEFIETFLKEKKASFDMILDDGSHTLEDMKEFIRLYLPLIKDDGIFIIEDVDNIGWLDELSKCVPEEFKPYIKTYDLRHMKDRWDDIVFTVDFSQRGL